MFYQFNKLVYILKSILDLVFQITSWRSDDDEILIRVHCPLFLVSEEHGSLFNYRKYRKKKRVKLMETEASLKNLVG
jgi:hypothetical protein